MRSPGSRRRCACGSRTSARSISRPSRTADGNPFDGSKTYKVTLPPNIPAARFWSFTVYDNQTRSMLDTPQRYPRAGSQSYPSPAAESNADGSTTVYFGPTQPEGVTRGNWIQTMPDRGWWTIIRLYSPLQAVLRQELAPGRHRIGISETRLPAGSLVRFREPSLWDQYKLYIVGAAASVRRRA